MKTHKALSGFQSLKEFNQFSFAVAKMRIWGYAITL